MISDHEGKMGFPGWKNKLFQLGLIGALMLSYVLEWYATVIAVIVAVITVLDGTRGKRKIERFAQLVSSFEWTRHHQLLKNVL
jgi:hypothetical protein